MDRGGTDRTGVGATSGPLPRRLPPTGSNGTREGPSQVLKRSTRGVPGVPTAAVHSAITTSTSQRRTPRLRG